MRQAGDPRGPQPPGPPHVRGRRSPGRPPGPGPHRPHPRPAARPRGSGGRSPPTRSAAWNGLRSPGTRRRRLVRRACPRNRRTSGPTSSASASSADRSVSPCAGPVGTSAASTTTPDRTDRALELGVIDAVGLDPDAEITFVATPVRSVAEAATEGAGRHDRPGHRRRLGEGADRRRGRRSPLRRRTPDGRLRAGGGRRRRRRPVRGGRLGADPDAPTPTTTPTPGSGRSCRPWAPRSSPSRPSATTSSSPWCPTCPTSPPPASCASPTNGPTSTPRCCASPPAASGT